MIVINLILKTYMHTNVWYNGTYIVFFFYMLSSLVAWVFFFFIIIKCKWKCLKGRWVKLLIKLNLMELIVYDNWIPYTNIKLTKREFFFFLQSDFKVNWRKVKKKFLFPVAICYFLKLSLVCIVETNMEISF